MKTSVNMYACCYIITKIEDLTPLTPRASTRSSRDGSVDLEKLEI